MKVSSFEELNKYLRQFVPGSILDGDFYNPQKMYELLPLVDNPQNKFKIIHVAGTSGKTSTCYYIAELLKSSGAKVGLSVSPHVFQINERIQINSVPLAEPEMCELFTEFINTPGLIELKPTYFECVITFALFVFARMNCTHVVMEVGLGGLKDATNIIDDRDKVAVITDIGLDHTRILGDTLEKIAFQKAGIIKSGNNVFCYDQNKILNDVIDKQVKESKAILHRLDEVELHRNARLNSDLPSYQKRNWLLAQQVAEFVINRDGLNKLDTEILLDSQKTIIPARLQHVQIGNKTLVIDGAHNPQKLNALVSSLKKLFPDKSYALLIAFMESKQATLDASLTILHSISDNVITTEFMASTDLPHKVMPSTELVSGCKKAGFSRVQSIKNTDDAFEELLKQPEDIILITGSFYLIGSLVDKVRQYIHG